MEGLFVIAIFVFLIIRTIKKHKASVKASQEKYRPPQAPPMGEGMSAYPWAQEAPKREPVQQRIDLDRAPMAPRVEHRHVEQVHTQAGGYGGEGDEMRYNTREVSCQTVGHVEQKAGGIKIPELNGESLASAVIMSEILGKPKALRR